MSNTFKVQRSWRAHHTLDDSLSRLEEVDKNGWRYGNNRKSFAKDKVIARRIDRAKSKMNFMKGDDNG